MTYYDKILHHPDMCTGLTRCVATITATEEKKGVGYYNHVLCFTYSSKTAQILPETPLVMSQFGFISITPISRPSRWLASFWKSACVKNSKHMEHL